MSDSGSNKKVANSLLALSSAAVLAVYAAGYLRTRAAADRFTVQAEGRRPAPPTPPGGGGPVPSPPTAAPAARPAAAAPPPTSPAIAAPRPPKTSRGFRLQAEEGATPPSKKKPAVADVALPSATVPATPAPVPEQAPVVIAPPPAPEPPPPPAPPAKPVYKDGTYFGWGTSRHGDIQAQVVIEGGRIKAATIAQCLTRYSCNVIANLPPQVAQRQSPETDYVSGATQSTNAFYYGVVEALSKAK